MRAIVTERPGDYDVMSVKDVALPSVGPREVLVRNGASGVCYHDHLIRVGIMKRGIRLTQDGRMTALPVVCVSKSR